MSKKTTMILLTCLLILFFLFIGLLHILSHSFNSPDYAIDAYFNDLNIEYTVHKENIKGHHVRYVETGLKADSSTLLLFIHGAPGTWDAFKEYLADFDLNNEFRMISIDRLGYGGSEFGKSQVDLEKHADIIIGILEKYHKTRSIIVSHSYGSPISAVVASKVPSIVDGLIMCAPVNDYNSEPVLWYSKLADLKVMRFLLPTFITVATDEKMNHIQSLKNISQHWDNVKCPILVYHGTDDSLAPYTGNVEFMKANYAEDQLTVVTEDEGGHLLIWFKAASFKRLILEFYNSIR